MLEVASWEHDEILNEMEISSLRQPARPSPSSSSSAAIEQILDTREVVRRYMAGTRQLSLQIESPLVGGSEDAAAGGYGVEATSSARHATYEVCG